MNWTILQQEILLQTIEKSRHKLLVETKRWTSQEYSLSSKKFRKFRFDGKTAATRNIDGLTS